MCKIMKEYKSLLAYLLVSASLTSAINSAAIASTAIDRNYAQSQNNPAPTLDLSKATLTLQDLPPGFTKESAQEDNFKKQISQQKDFKPETVFAFQKVDSKYFQLVLGFTLLAPVEIDRASFDASFPKSEFAQNFVTALNEGNQVNFSKVVEQPLPDNIGQFSAGWTSRGTMEGIPMRIDVGIFGRGKLVSCLLTLYVEGNSSTVPISELARKLDNRIIQLNSPAETRPQ
jgi:hypothetical protein